MGRQCKKKRRMHLVNWQKVMRNKEAGGLGVRNLKLHNKSLLCKWLWRFNEEGDEPWKNLITIKYGKKDFWDPSLVVTYAGASLWKYLSSLWPLLQGNIMVKTGDGNKARFWTDVWAGDGIDGKISPYSFTTNKLCTVAECHSGT